MDTEKQFLEEEGESTMVSNLQQSCM
jgi:hypothetical protein